MNKFLRSCLYVFQMIALSTSARVTETIMVNSAEWNGPVVLTNSLVIASNQSATITAMHTARPEYPYSPPPLSALDIIKDGQTFSFSVYSYAGSLLKNSGTGPTWNTITPIEGPATIRLRLEPSAEKGYAYFTADVREEGFSPERCVIVPPGSKGAQVALQRSTNLMHWIDATNGTFSAEGIATFFRVTVNGLIQSNSFQNTAKELSGQIKTLSVHNGKLADEISVGAYQTAELVAVGPTRTLQLEIQRGAIKVLMNPSFSYTLDSISEDWKRWSPVRGPATIRLFAAPSAGSGSGYVTVRVTSEQYPPDKALVVLPGTNSYRINLELSTDLKNWSTATNGTYTSPAAVFFRINNQTVDGI